MIFSLAHLFVASNAFIGPLNKNEQSYTPDVIEEAWENWVQKNLRSYPTLEEEASRKKAFEQNWHTVTEHNARKASWTMALNQYADMTPEEFARTRLFAPQNCSATATTGPRPLFYGDLPESKDWQEEGAVSPVKDQGSCGSCWTFSSSGAIESGNYLANGEMLDISEQQLVDCAQAYDNNGCNGGLPSHAFQYVMANGGIETEHEYPYFAQDMQCKFDDKMPKLVQLQGAVNITKNDEDELLQAVGLVSPVSIAYDCSKDFFLYAGGIYDPSQSKPGEQCGQNEDQVNHAVLAVGYGEEDGVKYWKVKNSWNSSWGEEGFFRIVRGVNACGLTNCASLPIVKENSKKTDELSKMLEGGSQPQTMVA